MTTGSVDPLTTLRRRSTHRRGADDGPAVRRVGDRHAGPGRRDGHGQGAARLLDAVGHDELDRDVGADAGAGVAVGDGPVGPEGDHVRAVRRGRHQEQVVARSGTPCRPARCRTRCRPPRWTPPTGAPVPRAAVTPAGTTEIVTRAVAVAPAPLLTWYSMAGTAAAVSLTVIWSARAVADDRDRADVRRQRRHRVDDHAGAVDAGVVVQHPQHGGPAGPDAELVVDGPRLADRHGRAVRRQPGQIVRGGRVLVDDGAARPGRPA